MTNKIITLILKSNKTVFSFKDIFLLSGETNSTLLKRRINYYVSRGYLHPIRRGIYAKDKDYNKFELACKIYSPAYISFETVLIQAGIIFQFYSKIFVASYKSKEINIEKQDFIFKKIKAEILTNALGIESNGNYSIASPERALLDILYLNNDYHFDNLKTLNWETIYSLLAIYGGNRRMAKIVNKLYKISR